MKARAGLRHFFAIVMALLFAGRASAQTPATVYLPWELATTAPLASNITYLYPTNVGVDSVTGAVTTTDRLKYTNDATGTAHFTNLLPGTYTAVVQGPWKVTPVQFSLTNTSGTYNALNLSSVATNAGPAFAWSSVASDARYQFASSNLTLWAMLSTNVLQYLPTNGLGSAAYSNASAFQPATPNGSNWSQLGTNILLSLPYQGTNGVITNILAGAGLAGSTNGQTMTVTTNGQTPAANLTGSHTAPDSVLSTNVPLLNANNNFGGGITASSFTGNGNGLTNLNAAKLTGAAPTNLNVVVTNAGLSQQIYQTPNFYNGLTNMDVVTYDPSLSVFASSATVSGTNGQGVVTLTSGSIAGIQRGWSIIFPNDDQHAVTRVSGSHIYIYPPLGENYTNVELILNPVAGNYYDVTGINPTGMIDAGGSSWVSLYAQTSGLFLWDENSTTNGWQFGQQTYDGQEALSLSSWNPNCGGQLQITANADYNGLVIAKDYLATRGPLINEYFGNLQLGSSGAGGVPACAVTEVMSNLQVDAAIIIEKSITTSGTSVSNGVSALWNSNGFTYLRSSRVSATNFADTLLASPP
jgi:hypothetical protein